MKKQLLFSLFIFNVLFVCGQEIIPLKDALSLKECKVSEYASSIEYIPLEDSEECLLTQDLHVIVASQYIFVLDYKENRTCRFDKTGKFMNFIGKRGQGPGEYNRLFGIYVDDATQECFLLEPFSNRINVYDYNGTFKRNIHVKCAPDRMMKLGDNYVLNHTLMNVNKYELTLINSEGKTIKQSNRESNKQVGMSFWSPFFYISENMYFIKNIYQNTFIGLIMI